MPSVFGFPSAECQPGMLQSTLRAAFLAAQRCRRGVRWPRNHHSPGGTAASTVGSARVEFSSLRTRFSADAALRKSESELTVPCRTPAVGRMTLQWLEPPMLSCLCSGKYTYTTEKRAYGFRHSRDAIACAHLRRIQQGVRETDACEHDAQRHVVVADKPATQAKEDQQAGVYRSSIGCF